MSTSANFLVASVFHGGKITMKGVQKWTADAKESWVDDRELIKRFSGSRHRLLYA